MTINLRNKSRDLYDDKLMYVSIDENRINLSVDQNYWWKRLDTQLNEQTNENSIKVSKVIIKLWGLVQ